MQAKLIEIQHQATEDLKKAQSVEKAEQIRVKYLGRKGLVNELIGKIPTLPLDQRASFGQLANKVKNELQQSFSEAIQQLSAVKTESFEEEFFDISLPGIRPPYGHKHPIVQTIDEIKEIFSKLGFAVAYGPEVETEYYNFEALNIPPDHPSRDDFDTFYLDDDVLLRSQTSTVQIHIMQKQSPPIRIIAPGKVFRPDTIDARHSSMFHQIEGLMVDEGVSFSDLKSVLTIFAMAFFGKDIKMRFRPSFFPFTEPSAEVDISCSICGGKGCSVCKGSGWVEILGAGMVDPNVFKAVGYDSEKYTGFAFGMGVERIAMLKHGIDDIRLFFENDLRFLSQF
ncbi:MAG TPA: phenylalanine--tRNA ligase subunit alpha [Candidatus Brocadiia bacterium]|nr:phenylalanine--tRNA ligase subunit alpha [Planctomycetota bacterium]MBI4008238.1 phenylalanine--tRNA ligase subunit alpha [Planctomycetota bacterium]MDO8094194.1 phenylalanine--tRNA ligase subunit alpha [Candidatus Brocadiales bacterium]